VNKWQQTWNEEHVLLLDQLDRAYEKLLAIHKDPGFLHSDSRVAVAARLEFKHAQDRIFIWKGTVEMLKAQQGKAERK